MTTPSFTLPEPSGLQFAQWGSVAAEQLAVYGVSPPGAETSWKEWACGLFFIPELVASNIPSPEGFETWDAWACPFIESLR